MTEPRVSVVVVSYNSSQYLATCLRGLLAQDHPSFEVILVDNGSTDGGPEEVEREFPEVRVIRSPENRHYTGGNNLGFAAAQGELVGSVNVDTEVAPGWLSAMVGALDAHPDAGIATAEVCLLDRRDLLNACGNVVHVSGLGFCRGLGMPAGSFPQIEDVPSISGAAFLARRSVLDEIGGFDESFYAYVEDTDLSLRALLAGHRVIYVPEAVVYHDYDLRMRPEKFYLLERNRTRPLGKILERRSLRLMVPAFWLSDLMTLVYALRGGPEYLDARRRARQWHREHAAELAAARAAVQATRRASDREIISRLSTGLPASQLSLSPALARIVTPLASAAFALSLLPARLLAR